MPCTGRQSGQGFPIFASMTFPARLCYPAATRGANLVAVSGLLRHASTRMSERYLHVTRADLRAAVETGRSELTIGEGGTHAEALLQSVHVNRTA